MSSVLHKTFVISGVFCCVLLLGGCDNVEFVENDPPASLPLAATNQAPAISGNPATTVLVGGSWSFTPSASDADGDSLTFDIQNKPAWANFDPQTGQLSGIPQLGDVGTHGEIRIAVSDGEMSAALPDFVVTVQNVSTNSAPQIIGRPANSVTVDQQYRFLPSASDPDGDELVFSIANSPDWASFDATTGRLRGTPVEGDAGVYDNIVIAASDGELSASLAPFTVTVQAASKPSPNNAPEIGGIPATLVTVDQQYLFLPSASDPDGDELTFSIVNRPAWATFSSTTGRLRGTPVEGDEGVYDNIVISVSDGDLSAALPGFAVTVQSAGNASPNNPPQISGSPATMAAVDEQYFFLPSASDPDGNGLTFSIVNRPSWVSFNSATGRLRGTPVEGDEGVYSGIVISVSDGELSAVLPAFAVTVENLNPNNPPQINGAPSTTATVDQQYLFLPNASDPDGDDLTFSIANRPSWVSFNSATGRLRGTPVEGDEGVYSGIVISVSDGDLSAMLPAFTVTVENLNPNDPPQISGAPPTTATVDQQYLFLPNASDPDGDGLTFSIVNRPSWASFNATTGRLRGTPVEGDEGVYSNIEISVSDGELSAALPAFSVTVENPNPNSPPQISGAPPTIAMVDQQYLFLPNASDPDGDDLTFSIANRPSWASFNATTGRLRGTPVEGDDGIYSNIEISVPPQISGTPPTSATVDQQYLFLPSASDPDGDDLTFSIVNRPSWASFNATTGRLRGTPVAGDEGIYSNIEISVSDTDLTASLPAFAITLAQAATGSVTLTWTPPTKNTDGSQLTDLAAYKIYYGLSQGDYPRPVARRLSE